jgi:hypothetical protein
MQQAITFLLSSANVPFAAALLLMLLIGAVEAIGLGSASIDVDLGAADSWLAWLGLGRVPLLVVLIVFLALFGVIGLAVQHVAAAVTGDVLSPWLASAAAMLGALPLTGLAGRGLARVLPRDETTAVALETLIGRTGTITNGKAERGSPARLRVEDRHGQAHFVMVEPANAGQVFREGETVLLVEKRAQHFSGVSYDNPLLARLDHD